MATATSYHVSTIKPAGGGDYTELSTWWATEKDRNEGSGVNIAAWAECYSGGDMAVVDLTGAGYTPTATYYTRIYAADGERHDGTGGGVYLDCPSTDNGITNQLNYTRIEGIRIELTLGAVKRGIRGYNYSNLLIDSCLIHFVNTAGDYGGAIGVGTVAGGDLTGIVIRNCLFYGGNTAYAIQAIMCYSETDTATITIQNCSISQITSSADANAAGIWFREVSGTLNITSTNNISTGNTDGRDFQETNTPAVTQTYCLSDDDTADDWGGAGNLINQTAADVFENVASDLNLKALSPACSAAISLASTFTTDAIGAARKAIADGNVGWDMGALTTGGNPWYYYASEEAAA